MKVIVEYDPVSGNIMLDNGAQWYIGNNLILPSANGFQESSANTDSEVVKLSNNGMTADDLIKMREAGVI